jgi:hypothetical protein
MPEPVDTNLFSPLAASSSLRASPDGAAAAASFLAAVLTEVYLCNACSCHEIFCVLFGGLFD